MPQKRPLDPELAEPFDRSVLMPPPVPPTSITSSKRRRLAAIPTPPPSIPATHFFTLPLPPSLCPAVPTHKTLSLTDFLSSQLSLLNSSTRTLYERAIDRLKSELTPSLTNEMRVSITSAVEVWLLHSSTIPTFLSRLAEGQIPESDLKEIADTITAALRAFSASGGPSPLSHLSPREMPGPTSPPHPTTSAINKSASARSTSSRSQRMRGLVKWRDGGRCVVTDSDNIEVAHILPFALGNSGGAFWEFLGLFWGADGVGSVRMAACGGEGVDTVGNMMSLGRDVHVAFDKGDLELLPEVRVDGRDGWDASSEANYTARIHFPGQTPLFLSRYSRDDRGIAISSTLLQGGTSITMSTSDPLTMPLPHPLLLQLHALVGRIRRMRAAAGYPILSYWEEEDSSSELGAGSVDTSVHLDCSGSGTEFEGEEIGEVVLDKEGGVYVGGKRDGKDWDLEAWENGRSFQLRDQILFEPDASTFRQSRAGYDLPELTEYGQQGAAVVSREPGAADMGNVGTGRNGNRKGKRARGEENTERSRKAIAVLEEVGQREQERWEVLKRKRNASWRVGL